MLPTISINSHECVNVLQSVDLWTQFAAVVHLSLFYALYYEKVHCTHITHFIILYFGK